MVIVITKSHTMSTGNGNTNCSNQLNSYSRGVNNVKQNFTSVIQGPEHYSDNQLHKAWNNPSDYPSYECKLDTNISSIT